MIRDIIRSKLTEKVRDILKEIDIEQILEEATDKALDNYGIEDIIIENVESIARDCVTDILDDDCEDMIYTTVANNFDVEEW